LSVEPAAPIGSERCVAVAGEALVDLVPAGDDLLAVVPGGSPANVAVGLARLDVPTEMLARLANDAFGRRLRAHLESNGVGLAYAVEAAERSSVAIFGRGPDGSDQYDFRVAGTADWQWADDELAAVHSEQLLALHVGSLAVTMPPGADAIRRLVSQVRAHATVSYDPNCRPVLMGSREVVLDGVLELVDAADVVKASADDLAWLLPERDPAEVAAEWLARGPALVAVTLGADGALAVSRDAGLVRCAGVKVDVVDTVGAGDSFTSALLAGLYRLQLLGAESRGALRSIGAAALSALVAGAVEASAITASRRGADPPRSDQLNAGAA
jgi:fructokinase